MTAEMGRIPEAWPLLLTREQVCAYVNMSSDTLKRVCPVPPIALGAKLLRWRRPDIDDYQRRLDEIDEDAGGLLPSDVTMTFVNKMKDAWAQRGYRVANMNLQVLKNAVLPAIIDGRIKSDPFQHVKKARRPHHAPESNPIWEEHEVEAIIQLALDRKMPGLAVQLLLADGADFDAALFAICPFMPERLATMMRGVGSDDFSG